MQGPVEKVLVFDGGDLVATVAVSEIAHYYARSLMASGQANPDQPYLDQYFVAFRFFYVADRDRLAALYRCLPVSLRIAMLFSVTRSGEEMNDADRFSSVLDAVSVLTATVQPELREHSPTIVDMQQVASDFLEAERTVAAEYPSLNEEMADRLLDIYKGKAILA
jgi:hypothetical protein